MAYAADPPRAEAALRAAAVELPANAKQPDGRLDALVATLQAASAGRDAGLASAAAVEVRSGQHFQATTSESWRKRGGGEASDVPVGRDDGGDANGGQRR